MAGADTPWGLDDNPAGQCSTGRCPFKVMRLSILTALLAGTAAAFAVAPDFSTATPAGGQRGTEVEVRLAGERLADAQEILFYDRGIEAVKILQATNNFVRA